MPPGRSWKAETRGPFLWRFRTLCVGMSRSASMCTRPSAPEFLRDCLTQVGSVLQAHEHSLSDFLNFCDLAKFARWSLSGEEMQGLLASARHFVESTGVPGPSKPVVVTETVNVPIRQS